MNNGILKTIEVEGTFLSPVHIGWGNELDPFCSFVRGNRLYHFEMARAVQRFSESDRTAFYSLIDKNNLTEIRKFLSARLDPEKDALASITVSESVAREYSAKIDDPRNQLIFEPFFRNGNRFSPIIPGSSLKGAIRTAVIDTVLEDTNIPLDGETLRNPKKMEARVLGYHGMEEDPFKALKVEDVDLGHESTIIYHVLNYSRNRTDLTDLGLRFECARSRLDGSNLSFCTMLLFFEGYKDKTIRVGRIEKKALSMFLEPELVFLACNKFYMKNLYEEYERFYAHSPYAEASQKLFEDANGFDANECLIRLGRFTQAESKSISRHRKVMVRGRGGRSRPMEFGTTRNLADGKYPMGWIKLKFHGLDINKIQKAGMKPPQKNTSREVSRRKVVPKAETKSGPVDLSGLGKKFQVKKRK